jgi:hypothetical protein
MRPDRGPAGSRRAGPVEDPLPLDEGLLYLRPEQVLRIQVEQVAVEHDQVGVLVHGDRPGDVVEVVHERRVHREAGDRRGKVEPLVR